MNLPDFKLPGEWEPHEATWLTWPQNQETWGKLLPEIKEFYTELILNMTPFEPVKLISMDPNLPGPLQELSQELTQELTIPKLEIIPQPTNDCWVRDYGAISCKSKSGTTRVLYNFNYNAWGEKYPPWDDDNRIPETMAKVHQQEIFPVDFVLEGGSIDSNGQGSLLTTESCVLNPNRNGRISKKEVEKAFYKHFSIENILWLTSKASMVGDDTDGHVDEVARFINPKTIVCAIEHNKNDENYTLLKNNWRELNHYAKTQPLEIIEIPMPSPVPINGIRTPASYLNFMIINGAVILPVFDDLADESVLNQFESLFPDRKIIPQNARLLTYGQGGMHCISSHVYAGE